MSSRVTCGWPRRRGERCAAWGLEILCRDPKYYSPSVTAVLLPDGHDADQFRGIALNTFNIAYGASFGPYAKKYFRIGHMGDVNDTMMLGALAATEMALALAGVPHQKGGVQPAMDYIVATQSRGAGGGGVSRRAGSLDEVALRKPRTDGHTSGTAATWFLNAGRAAIAANQRSKCPNTGRSGTS